MCLLLQKRKAILGSLFSILWRYFKHRSQLPVVSQDGSLNFA